MSDAKREHLLRMLGAVLALVCAWIAFDLIVWGFGESPKDLLIQMIQGTWGTGYGVGQVLFKATPLLLTGVAVHVALRGGLFNIGAEGQLAISSLAVGYVGSRLPSATHAAIALPVVIAVAALSGGIWAAFPAWLKARLGIHEVISMIMMNRIADAVVGLALGAGLALPGSVRMADLIPGAQVARLDVLVSSFRGSAASFALPLAIAIALLAVLMQRRTIFGREIALIGMNRGACEAAHIPVAKRIAQALVLSGAIAGLASAGTVLGYKGYFEQGLGANAGFGGIAVALLARGAGGGKEAGVSSFVVAFVLASLLFGTLQQGGLVINAHVPMDAMGILQAIVIVFVGLSDSAVSRGFLRWGRNSRSRAQVTG